MAGSVVSPTSPAGNNAFDFSVSIWSSRARIGLFGARRPLREPSRARIGLFYARQPLPKPLSGFSPRFKHHHSAPICPIADLSGIFSPRHTAELHGKPVLCFIVANLFRQFRRTTHYTRPQGIFRHFPENRFARKAVLIVSACNSVGGAPGRVQKHCRRGGRRGVRGR